MGYQRPGLLTEVSNLLRQKQSNHSYCDRHCHGHTPVLNTLYSPQGVALHLLQKLARFNELLTWTHCIPPAMLAASTKSHLPLLYPPIAQLSSNYSALHLPGLQTNCSNLALLRLFQAEICSHCCVLVLVGCDCHFPIKQAVCLGLGLQARLHHREVWQAGLQEHHLQTVHTAWSPETSDRELIDIQSCAGCQVTMGDQMDWWPE